MSLRFFPTPTPDPWTHREEDWSLARTNSQPKSTSRVDSDTSHQQTPNGSNPSSGDPSTEPAAAAAAAQQTPLSVPHKRWVVADHIAFEYLKADRSVTVVERRSVLRGYELYLVEQWACSRESPTLVIVTYTGDERHSVVVVGVVSVPADETTWSPRLRLYANAIHQYHARPKETDLGQVMVTNLSNFPSALTVIPVPDGDIRKHRQSFIVNENLKRLGCSGRSGMTLTNPTPATQAKFYQLYKVSDRPPFYESVLELVRSCQLALFLFGKLEPLYCDGLLCDKTETAIGNWWTELGAEYYNVEPTDGILGPTTVAALLGMLMGARNRLHYLGAQVAKDVFDMDATKRGISSFQKAHKLERTKRLDRQTIFKLHSVTAKPAKGEGWGVQKAVKSTVAEIGGKRGELVIGMVGGRDKGGIADIETLDIVKFVDLVSGERAKWLWYGKPKKAAPDSSEKAAEMGGILLRKDDTASAAAAAATPAAAAAAAAAFPSKRAQSLPVEEDTQRTKEETPPLPSAQVPVSAVTMPESGSAEKDALRKTVFKSVAGRVSDARSGLGRIKDTIGGGRRGHSSRPSRDEHAESGYANANPSISALASSAAAIGSPTAVNRVFTWHNKPEEYVNAMRKESEQQQQQQQGQFYPPSRSSQDFVDRSAGAESGNQQSSAGPGSSAVGSERNHHVNGAIKEEEDEGQDVRASVAGSALDGDLLGPLEAERSENAGALYLQRRHSIICLSRPPDATIDEARWPRRLSFGDAVEAVLRWDDDMAGIDPPESTSTSTSTSTKPSDPAAAFRQQAAVAELARTLYSSVRTVRDGISPWVASKVSSVEDLEAHYGREKDALQTLYYQLSEAYRRARRGSAELVAAERERVVEAVREVEVLVARLEYEVTALGGKVGDLEDGVRVFERQVEDVEVRAHELKVALETETWLHWAVRTVTGVGTGPNITRGQET
ncbi:hypothetical protein SODALDRAFT_308900 [Sodiomyces alkalinus F11]|uniref:STB6-like N-terminal domain-containing protein n=1 Tax=Sodiomyces alkalinus (strain CBS 110278 / VKM F-3762 / F11) TaxID=1314773 RepID=A0A3N2PYA2_SODAK|nr:hypothetical protein SODALDRAFT_308900 [Sodiomyces alkalinus F11]ROT39519.1 hypothetical protein SODALDRAFT_308900 [Sodiomyces alkalinus F11]